VHKLKTPRVWINLLLCVS